jgi:lipopolysaccharide export system protein LptA
VVDIKLNAGRSKITYMTASGKAAYEMRSNNDGMRFISGGRMVFTAGTTGALEKALISEHANLLVKSADGERILRAGEIELLLDSVTGEIREINGITGANFLNRRDAEETLASGDAIYAEFADTGGLLRHVRLSGQSRLTISGSGKAANELRAETIDARFRAEGENIEVLTADEAVRWIFGQPGADAARTLLASKLEILYAGNHPESGEASGAVTIEESAVARMTRRIKAERMRFDFFPAAGQIRNLIAENGVSAVYGSDTPSPGISDIERYQTFSDDLEVFFVLNNGISEIRQAAQRGNFRFVSGERSATADRGEYDAENNRLTLTGSPEIFDGTGRVSGDRIEYDLDTDELTARGRVRAVLNARQGRRSLFQTGGGASPVVVTSEDLRYRAADERFKFSGGVVALTESQQLNAREIDIGGHGDITAAGAVIHRIHDTAAAAVIESGLMEYRRDVGTIRYSGKVEMKSKEMTFSADVLNATLDDEAKDIRRVTAEGNVLVRHDGRVCRGDAAEWDPSSSNYVVTGAPAMIDDRARGRSMARRLTYFQGEDRISLEP